MYRWSVHLKPNSRQATDIVDELEICIGILLQGIAELDAMHRLHGGAREAGCHRRWGGSWGSGNRSGCSRHRRWHGGCRRGTLHREVAGPRHVGAIHEVPDLSSIVRGWQRRARSVRIGLHGLRMVQGVACCVHWCAVREVANGVGENRPWQRRSWSVWVRSDGLRVVDGVACPVHGSAIWQVA